MYATDQFVYDNIQFKTEIEADHGDKVISIGKNTTEQTIKVTINDE